MSIMNLCEFSQQHNHCYESDNKFLFWQIVAEDSFTTCSIQSNDEIIVAHVLVLSGWMEVRYREKMYSLKKNDFGHFIHGTNFEVTAVSDNIDAYIMITTDSYNMILFKSAPPLPFSLVSTALSQPITAMRSSVFSSLSFRMQCIRDIAADQNHIFRNEMIKNAILIFLMDMANLYTRHYGGNINSPHGRKQEVLFLFMNLLKQHIRQQHSVGFYASELCISHQYLNRIIKELTEKTAYELLCDSLVGEIVKMIDGTNMSMQQIADELCFPDQATLSKFFKRQTGYSLTEYRKKGIPG